MYTQAQAQSSARKAIGKLKLKSYKLPKVCRIMMSVLVFHFIDCLQWYDICSVYVYIHVYTY